MGSGNSRELFVHMLKNMLRARGAKIEKQKLTEFLHFVEEVCPWFPKEGSVNIETWEKVGERLRDYYNVHGPCKMPVDTFSLWNMIKDSIDPRHEKDKIKEQTAKEEKPALPEEPREKLLPWNFRN